MKRLDYRVASGLLNQTVIVTHYGARQVIVEKLKKYDKEYLDNKLITQYIF